LKNELAGGRLLGTQEWGKSRYLKMKRSKQN